MKNKCDSVIGERESSFVQIPERTRLRKIERESVLVSPAKRIIFDPTAFSVQLSLWLLFQICLFLLFILDLGTSVSGDKCENFDSRLYISVCEQYSFIRLESKGLRT